MNLEELLGQIGLKPEYVQRSPNFRFWRKEEFKYYNTEEYLNSKKHDMDEFYGIHECNLLHLATSLRIRMTTTEDYSGEEVTYRLFKLYILTEQGELDVSEINLNKGTCVAEGKEYKFTELIKE